MNKLITAFFIVLSVTSFAETTNKITNFLMGQISDIAHKEFVKVDSIAITSPTEATYSNYFLGTIT